MKQIKHIKFLVIILFLCSCGDKTNEQNLKNENERLKKIEIQYLKQTEILENSIVIPYDSLSNYFLPMTCGYDIIEVNEKVQFTTLLAWHKLPSNIKIEFVYDKSDAQLSDKKPTDLNRHLIQTFNVKGEKETYGEYIITFPNGKKESFRWGRFVTVK